MTGSIHIYHGSVNIVEEPVFGQGKSYNEKGLGINEVITMYYPLHEADLKKFVSIADSIIDRAKTKNSSPNKC